VIDNNILRLPFAIGLVLLFITSSAAVAEITVQTDRNPVGLNESFELTFTAGGSVDDDPDFTPLEDDFDLLDQAQSSNISVINGDFSRTTQWTVHLMPRRAGILTIPPIAFGRESSPPFEITVTATPSNRNEQSADTDIVLEVEAEPANPYVQQQVIVTVRVLHRVEIAQASLSEPELSDAIVEKLGKDSRYQTRRNGMNYAVIERKYAIFPQHSGEAAIPPQELKAQVPAGRRSRAMFDDFFNRRMTRTRRVRSEPVPLQVRPIPEAFTGSHWLPAKQVTLEQQWSQKPPTVPAGEPITRTISLAAEGATVSQLPETRQANQTIGSTDGDIKQYPDQPTLEENKTVDGLISRREEKTALIPSKAGDYTLPALAVPWWNIRTDRMEIARLPQQVLQAMPPSDAEASASSQETPPAAEQVVASKPLSTIANDTGPEPMVWQWAALFFAVGWTATAAAWWRHHKRTLEPVEEEAVGLSEKSTAKAVKKACSNNHPDQTKEALLAWAKAHWQQPPRSLAEIARQCDNPARIEIERLDRALYSSQPEAWRVNDLWQAFSSMQKKQPHKEQTKRPVLEPLYKT